MSKKILNAEKELLLLVEYLKKTWVFPVAFSNDDIIDLIREPFEIGMKYTEKSFAFFNSETSLHFYDLMDKRKSKSDDYLAVFTDAYYNLLFSLQTKTSTFYNAFFKEFNYSNKCKPSIKLAREKVNTGTVCPKGYTCHGEQDYEQIKLVFNDFDTFDYYEGENSEYKKQKSLFKGDPLKNCSSFPIIERIALHNVLESEINQGRDPLQTLISTVLTHGMQLQDINNTNEIFNIIINLNVPKKLSKEKIDIPDNDLLSFLIK